jgi:hypothetical protein
MRFSSQASICLADLSAIVLGGLVPRGDITTAADFNETRLYEQYAASSYYDSRTDGTPNIVSCDGATPDNSPLVESNGAATLV